MAKVIQKYGARVQTFVYSSRPPGLPSGVCSPALPVFLRLLPRSREQQRSPRATSLGGPISSPWSHTHSMETLAGGPLTPQYVRPPSCSLAFPGWDGGWVVDGHFACVGAHHHRTVAPLDQVGPTVRKREAGQPKDTSQPSRPGKLALSTQTRKKTGCLAIRHSRN